MEDWKTVLDETHVDVRGHRSRFVPRSKGGPIREGHIEQKSQHVPKKKFGSSFSSNVLGRLRVIEGMMKSTKS